MGRHAAACEPQYAFTTRDAKLRCMRCGSFAAGIPLCNECTKDVMKVVEERRVRMQAVFYSIIFFGILAYYLVI